MKAKVLIIILSLSMFSCNNSNKKKPPVNLSGIEKVSDVTVPYKEMGGVKTIPVAVNGVAMEMIYDTGCSGMHLSLHEVQTLAKNGKLSETDIIGSSKSQIADGSVVENVLIVLRDVQIGGETGFQLHNIQATVSQNQQAPVLLGNGVLDELASVEVDNVEKVIKFKMY